MKYLRHIVLIPFILFCGSCKTTGGRWSDGLSGYAEKHSGSLSVEILRTASGGDTAFVNYRVRIRPSTKNIGTTGAAYNFYYGMDSCFSLRSGHKDLAPAFVQAVPDGIKGCFEYLVSFEVAAPSKLRPLALVYRDRFIDQKSYILSLNKQ